jgi:hypothetical protein
MPGPDASCGTWTAYKPSPARRGCLGPVQRAQRARSRGRYDQHRDRYLANANRRYAEIVAPARRVRATRRLICPACGSAFTTTSAAKRYCAPACR